ncbi:hypothetical protein ACUXCC_004627 [Cytobacillus horneckiae]
MAIGARRMQHSDVATGRGVFSLNFDNQALTVRSSPPILYHSI